MTFGNTDGYREFTAIPGYRRAVTKTSKRTGKTIRRPDLPGRYVMHCTDGLRFYDYPYPPQYTIVWGGGHGLAPGNTYDLWDYFDAETLDGPRYYTVSYGDVLKLQHCHAGKSGYALKAASGYETNHAGPLPQCEFTYRARDGVAMFDWELQLIGEAIAEQIQATRDAHGNQSLIDPNIITDFRGSESWGYGDPYEMTPEAWYKFGGITGHQSVPGQSHWDPGNINHVRIRDVVIAKLRRPFMYIERISGDNRYGTAAELAKKVFTVPQGVVYIATGHNFPDALSAATAGLPVLLVANGGVPSETKQALEVLRPSKLYIVGGPAAVSDIVAQELEDIMRAINT